jgi:hypothetical protein
MPVQGASFPEWGEFQSSNLEERRVPDDDLKRELEGKAMPVFVLGRLSISLRTSQMRTKRRNQLKKSGDPKKQKKHSGNASVAKWNKREDIEFDEEDACAFQIPMVILFALTIHQFMKTVIRLCSRGKRPIYQTTTSRMKYSP